MKLLFFDEYKLGVLKGDRVVDVSGAAPRPQGLPDPTLAAEGIIEAVIDGFAGYRPKFAEIVARESGVPISQVKVRPPLPRPRNPFCAFANYRDRADSTTPPTPLDYFHKSASSIIGQDETVELPDIPDAIVFQPEPELAYLIGRRGKNVAEADALSYVFGYMNFVDVSARGMPNRRTPFLGKALDTWAPMGPVITTRDEVPDPQKVQMRLWLNGELKQDYNTNAMAHSVATQIAWLSQYVTLMPGDVVSCGVFHVGLTPINDGDAVEVEGQGLERLRFKVKSHGPVKTAHWRPPGTRDA